MVLIVDAIRLNLLCHSWSHLLQESSN